MTTPTNNIHKRGFASMDKDRLREVSSRAGASVPADKRSFSRDPELAKRAGALGGAKRPKVVNGTTRYFDYQSAVLAGFKAGVKSWSVVHHTPSGEPEFWTVPG